jgi:hypothetical protein
MPPNEENEITKEANVAANRVAYVTAAREKIMKDKEDAKKEKKENATLKKKAAADQKKEREQQEKEKRENATLERKAAAEQKATKRKAPMTTGSGTHPYITRPSASVFA